MENIDNKTKRNRKKEFYEKHKEEMKQRNLEYYQQNKEEVRRKRREKVICDVCLGVVSRENLPRHKKNPKCALVKEVREQEESRKKEKEEQQKGESF